MREIRCAIILTIIIAGCNLKKKTDSTNVRDNTNTIRCDSVLNFIKTGDIVFRLGNDMTSYMLSQLNRRDKSFSHCGVASRENGKIWVYHAIGGEYNPDQKIKRETAEKWFSPDNNLALGIVRWDMDSLQKKNFVATIIQYYKEGREFDMRFDLQSDDRLYCAEMIYKAARKATRDTGYLPHTRMWGKVYEGVDDLFLNKHSSTVCRLRYK